MHRLISYLPALLFIMITVSTGCGSESPSVEPTDTVTTTPPGETNSQNDTLTEDEKLFAWVTDLNVRAEPKTGAPVVATVQPSTPLVFSGEQSSPSETIVLRGVAYDEPWYKITTPDGQEGWVFGGAVKREGEMKGNAPITDTQFNFPAFGRYNLADWQKLDTRDESGGDAEIMTTLYQNGNQFLEIEQTEMGEYGYSVTHRLMNKNKQLLKEREIHFQNDSGESTLTETVKDYTQDPSIKYTRSQPMSKSHFQLNARPMMISGNWEESHL